MPKHRQALLAVCLLGALASAAAQSSCAAESTCLPQGCTAAYAQNAANFPYTVEYTTTGDDLTTTFVWKICSTMCPAGGQLCKALSGLQLRLSNSILSDPKSFRTTPPGAMVTSCSPRGPGLLWTAPELKTLSTFDPSTEEACRLLTFTMYRDPGQGEQLNLQDICQQNIQIVDQQGATVFAQTEPSCMYVAELADGTSGYSYVKEKVPKIMEPDSSGSAQADRSTPPASEQSGSDQPGQPATPQPEQPALPMIQQPSVGQPQQPSTPQPEQSYMPSGEQPAAGQPQQPGTLQLDPALTVPVPNTQPTFVAPLPTYSGVQTASVPESPASAPPTLFRRRLL